MHATLARGIATAALAAGFAGAGLYLFGNAPAGTFGLSPSFLPGAPLLRVDSVAPGGPAERAGLLAGDVLSARGRSLDDRSSLVLLANLPLVAVGDRAAIVVNRGAQRRDAELNAAPNPESPRLEAVYFAALSMPLLLLGWLIVWKKPRSDDAVTLGAMLMLLGLWNAVPDRIGGAFERLIWYQIVGSLLVTLGVFLAVVFFARYPAGSALGASPLRRLLLRVAVAFTVVQTAGLAYFFVAPVFFGTVPWVVVIGTWSAVVTPLAALACFIDAFRHGDAIERTRLRWLGASFFLGFSGPLLIPPAFGILGPGFTVIHQVLFESTLFILALGLAYAILRRRVMDIAFVLNRALVFSAVSAIVVTLFITFEWLIGLVFIHLSRPTSFTVEVIAAVIIGFSLRPIHERVDRVIDRVFFARRHAAEKALHHLATEIHFIRDRSVLVERVVRDVATHLEVAFVALYFRQDLHADFALLYSNVDAPRSVDPDDDVALALAVEETPIELHRRRTEIAGELAVPIAVRKVLVGILVLGEKTSGEAFAPDEVELLRTLAAYLGPALAMNAPVVPGIADDALLAELLAEIRSQGVELRRIGDAIAGPKATAAGEKG